MINTASLQSLRKGGLHPSFRHPLYEGYAFSRLPQTMSHLLTGEGGNILPQEAFGGDAGPYDIVILLFIDGFGWKFFEEASSKFPFLQRIISEGTASAISSQFPSTTAAHVTSINTGLEVGQTGIYEWFYYEPLVGRVIAPLPFSFAGDHVQNGLCKTSLTPDALLPFETLYEQLARVGVKSFVLQHEAIAHSPYSKRMCRGAEVIPYRPFSEGLKKMVEICQAPSSSPTYFFLYFGDIDAMGHRHGLESVEFQEAISRCWSDLEEHFCNKIQPGGKKIALCLTADHGMVPVNPEKTLYLNRLIPNITEFFPLDIRGKPIVPAGSCRDFFLHVKEEKRAELEDLVRNKLKGIAEVCRVEDLMREGYFGKEAPSKRFKERVGDLVILPYVGESVWWYEKHHFEQHFFAAHGGLSKEEMDSIFLFLPVS